MRPVGLHAIKRIAREIRQWAELRRPRRWDPNLGGMCAIAARELFRRLKIAGFKPVIVYTKDHAFIRIRNYIVDVTATQFNTQWILNQRDGKKYKPVEVVLIRQSKQDPIWGIKPSHIADNLRSGECYEKQNRWTRAPHQKLLKEHPLSYTVKI